MSRHEAGESVATRIRERQAWALFTIDPFRPGFGRHRAETVAVSA